MGLLDFKMPDMDSPQGQGLLAAAFSLMGAKGNSMSDAVGDAGMKYMGVYQNARSLADQKAMRDLQMKQAQMQMEEAKRKQEAEARQRQWSEQLPGVMGQKVYGASDVGPTMEPDVNALNQHLMSPDSPFRDKLIEKKLFPEKTSFMAVAPGASVFNERTGKIEYSNPTKPDTDPKITQYEYAKRNGYKGSFEQFVTLGPALMAAAAAPLRNAQVANIEAENDYNLPAPRKPQANVTVTTPDGRVFSFPNQAAANKFKLNAGIK